MTRSLVFCVPFRPVSVVIFSESFSCPCYSTSNEKMNYVNAPYLLQSNEFSSLECESCQKISSRDIERVRMFRRWRNRESKTRQQKKIETPARFFERLEKCVNGHSKYWHSWAACYCRELNFILFIHSFIVFFQQ